MRGWWRSGAAALGAVLLACGSNGDGAGSQLTTGPTVIPDEPAPTGDGIGDGGGTETGGGAGEEGGDETGTTEPGCDGHVTVRLLGTNVGVDLSALHVEPGALQVTSGAALVVTGATAGALDLAQPQAYRLGIVTPPDGATAATAVLPISAAHAAGTLVTGDLDVCTGPIEFTFDPARVDPRRCHVVVELDVARSVQPALGAGGSPFLLPQFKVVY
jgi:hypothetical protein